MVDKRIFHGYVIIFEYLSVIITILWFVLMVNAINLIDGLDGLAAGVVLFSALILLVLAVLGGRFVVAMGKRGDSSRFFCSFMWAGKAGTTPCLRPGFSSGRRPGFSRIPRSQE